MMRQVNNPRSRHTLRMRSIGSGGQTLGEELLEWGKEVMGVTMNEFYGQMEVNLVVGNCSEVMEIRPGPMGKPTPGSHGGNTGQVRRSGLSGTGGGGRYQAARSRNVPRVLRQPTSD
jgi:acyl-coenzyme A synthetase/AMP-(fatty) acid ligase